MWLETDTSNSSSWPPVQLSVSGWPRFTPAMEFQFVNVKLAGSVAETLNALTCVPPVLLSVYVPPGVNVPAGKLRRNTGPTELGILVMTLPEATFGPLN